MTRSIVKPDPAADKLGRADLWSQHPIVRGAIQINPHLYHHRKGGELRRRQMIESLMIALHFHK